MKLWYAVLAVCFVSGLSSCKDSSQPCNPHDGTKNANGKAFVSCRVGLGQSLPEVRHDEMLDMLDKYSGVTDGITYFINRSHAPCPVDSITPRLSILKIRMEQARARGYRAGINVHPTIGFFEQNYPNSLQQEDYTCKMDIDGKVASRGRFCPHDPRMQDYIRRLYTAVAQANPDYIWIDDDIYMGFQECYCDRCIRHFNRETGKAYTRVSLKKAMYAGSFEERQATNKAWLQHNRHTIRRLLALVEQTVHEVNPAMPLGFMNYDGTGDGMGYGLWAEALSGKNRLPVMWRPGEGNYTDELSSGVSTKAHLIGRQVSFLPASVENIQAEIENFPYQRLKKSANYVALEAASYIASGCTGAAFNIFPYAVQPLGDIRPLDEYEPLLSRLQKLRPFLDLMASELGRSPLTGIQTFFHQDMYLTGVPVLNHELYDTGLPACYAAGNAQVVILSKDNVYALSREEITGLLSGGVYMDVETLQQLNDMGFGHLTGFAVAAKNDDRIECFADHSLNGLFSGWVRHCSHAWGSQAYDLYKTDDRAQVLAYPADFEQRKTGSCTMGVFENELHGRICVAGYFPWTYMATLSKTSQMKSVFRWLSGDRLPAYIASFHKISLWVRESVNGKTVLSFGNLSFDTAENVTLMLKTDQPSIRVYDMNCKETTVRSTGSDGGYRKFVIPVAEARHIYLVVN